jgi:hypothetical protein
VRTSQIIGSWLIVSVVYSAIAGLSLCAGLVVKHLFSPTTPIPSFKVLGEVVLFAGMLAAVPGLIANIKKSRG